jgi:hypothetical protein
MGKLAQPEGGKDSIAACARGRRLKEFDGLDVLRKQQFPVNWMFAGDRRSVAAKPGERHMRPERPLARLPIGLKERSAQCRDFIASRTVRPEQAGPFRPRTVPDMLVCHPESSEPAGHKAKPFDGVGYRSLVPRGHKCQVDVGRRDRPNRRIFETCGKPGKFARNPGRGLHTHKDADPRCGIRIRSCNAGFVR